MEYDRLWRLCRFHIAVPCSISDYPSKSEAINSIPPSKPISAHQESLEVFDGFQYASLGHPILVRWDLGLATSLAAIPFFEYPLLSSNPAPAPARWNMSITSRQSSRELSLASGRTISRRTVAQSLYESGLYRRRSVVCVTLTSTHRRARLIWCRQHVTWSPEQLANVLYSANSHFSMQPDLRCFFLFGESEELDAIPPTSGKGIAKVVVMCWFGEGITIKGRTLLHVFDGGCPDCP